MNWHFYCFRIPQLAEFKMHWKLDLGCAILSLSVLWMLVVSVRNHFKEKTKVHELTADELTLAETDTVQNMVVLRGPKMQDVHETEESQEEQGGRAESILPLTGKARKPYYLAWLLWGALWGLAFPWVLITNAGNPEWLRARGVVLAAVVLFGSYFAVLLFFLERLTRSVRTTVRVAAAVAHMGAVLLALTYIHQSTLKGVDTEAKSAEPKVKVHSQ